MAFEPIKTQEELDEILKDRLERKERTVREEVEKELEKKYSDYKDLKETNKSLTNQVNTFKDSKTTLENQLEELKGKVKNYEIKETKQRIAIENGLPIKFANRLQGEDEEALIEDAKAFSEYFKRNEDPAPDVNNEPNVNDDEKVAGYKQLLNNIKGER